jgi:aspartate racemase
VHEHDAQVARVERAVPLPLPHIADPTAERIKAAGLARIGLRHAVHDGAGVLPRPPESRHRLTCSSPPEHREIVHRVAYEELLPREGARAFEEEYWQSWRR